jgi:hypothetical protein
MVQYTGNFEINGVSVEIGDEVDLMYEETGAKVHRAVLAGVQDDRFWFLSETLDPELDQSHLKECDIWSIKVVKPAADVIDEHSYGNFVKGARVCVLKGIVVIVGELTIFYRGIAMALTDHGQILYGLCECFHHESEFI